MTGQGLLGSRLSPRTLAITVGAAVVLTPISTVALPPDMARAAPALTLLEEVDCATGLDGAAVVFSVDGHEAGQQYWVTSTDPDGKDRVSAAQIRYRTDDGATVESGLWHASIGPGLQTVEVSLGDWEGPTGTPLASGSYVGDCTFVPFPDFPGFADGEWDVPEGGEHVEWEVNGNDELVATTTRSSTLMTATPQDEDGYIAGGHWALSESLNYGPVPVSAAGSAHFTGIFAGHTWTTWPCHISMGGGGFWPGHVVAYWGTNDLTVSAAARDGQFREWSMSIPRPGTPDGTYSPSLAVAPGEVGNWWDPGYGPYVLRATDDATGEVIGQTTVTEHCGVVYDPLTREVIDVPAAPPVTADGTWIVPEWDDTFQWVVLMDGSLQVRVLSPWSTFPDGEVVHTYDLPTTSEPTPTIERSFGGDRYETAATLALDNFEPGLNRVYLATGKDYPDALAGAALAGHDGAPILLAHDRASLPAATAAALSELAPAKVVALGGANVIRDSVLDEVRNLGIEVQRVAGKDRYETAIGVGTLMPESDTVYLATGKTFPDALAAGALAGKQGAPILLTRPGSLPAAVAADLNRRNPAHVILVGGPGAVSDDVLQQVEALGLSVTRMAGENRYETAAQIAGLWGEGTEATWVATGETFADALTAAPLAARRDGPIVLTKTDTLPLATATALLTLAPAQVHVLGGEGAVSSTVVSQIQSLPWVL